MAIMMVVLIYTRVINIFAKLVFLPLFLTIKLVIRIIVTIFFAIFIVCINPRHLTRLCLLPLLLFHLLLLLSHSCTLVLSNKFMHCYYLLILLLVHSITIN